MVEFAAEIDLNRERGSQRQSCLLTQPTRIADRQFERAASAAGRQQRELALTLRDDGIILIAAGTESQIESSLSQTQRAASFLSLSPKLQSQPVSLRQDDQIDPGLGSRIQRIQIQSLDLDNGGFLCDQEVRAIGFLRRCRS